MSNVLMTLNYLIYINKIKKVGKNKGNNINNMM